MADEQKKVDILFNIVDKGGKQTAQSIQALVDRAKAMNEQTKAMKAESRALDAQYKALAESILLTSGGFERAEDITADLNNELSQMLRQLDLNESQVKSLNSAFGNSDGVKKFEKQIRDAAEASELYGDASSRFASIGGLASGLGATGLSSNIMALSDALDAAEGVKRLKAELPALAEKLGLSTQTLVGLGAVAAVAAVAFGIVKSALEKIYDTSNKFSRAYLSYEEEYWKIRTNGTTESAKAALDQQQAELKAKEARRDEIKYILDQAEASEGAAGAAYDGVQVWNSAAGLLSDSLTINAGGMRDFESELKTLDEEITGLQLSTNRLASDLANGTFIANDMAEMEQKIADARLAQIEAQSDLWAQSQTWTEEELDSQIESQKTLQKAAQMSADEMKRTADYGAQYADLHQSEIDQAKQTLTEYQGSLQAALDAKDQASIDYWTKEVQRQRDLVTVMEAPIVEGQKAAASMQQYADAVDTYAKNIEYMDSTLRGEAQARDAEAKATQDVIDTIDRVTKANADAASMTREQANQELASNQIREQAIQAYLDDLREEAKTNEAAAAQVSAYEEELKNLQARDAAITEVILPEIEAREKEAEAIQEQKDAIEAAKKAAEEAAKTQQAVADLTKQYNDETEKIEQKRRLTSEREQLDWMRKEAAALAKHYADLAAIDERFYEQEADALDKIAEITTGSDKEELKAQAEYARESARLAKQHKNKMLEIEKSLSNSLAASIEDRSVGAAIEAVRSAKQQAEQEQQNYEDQKAERDEEYKLQLAELKEQRDEKLKAAQKDLEDLREKHRKERDAAIAAFQQQRQEASQQRQIALNQQREDWRIEDTERQTNFQNQVNKLTGHHTNTETATSNHYTRLGTIHSKGMGDIEAAVKKAYEGIEMPDKGSGSTGGSGGTGKGSLPGKYGFGGSPKPGSIGYVNDRGKKEPILFRGYNQVFPDDASLLNFLGAGKGGNTISIALDAPITVGTGGDKQTAKDIVKEVEAVIIPKIAAVTERALAQAGR